MQNAAGAPAQPPRADGPRAGAPAPSRRREGLASGLLTGLLLSTVTSSAILVDRLTRGEPWVVLVTDAVTASVAVLVLATTCRWFFDAPFSSSTGASGEARVRAALRARLVRVMLAQAVGAVLGVLAVHLALRGSPFGAYAWLSERPPQLVNDFASAFGALALLWACAWQPVGALSSLIAVAISALYAFTAPRWHLDAWGEALRHGAHAPISVQLAVLVQLACTAVGVSAFHRRSASQERGFDAL